MINRLYIIMSLFCIGLSVQQKLLLECKECWEYGVQCITETYNQTYCCHKESRRC